MQFELSDTQLEKFEKWADDNNFSQTDAGSFGGAFTFLFCPTGTGDLITVRHMSGAELELTEFEYF